MSFDYHSFNPGHYLSDLTQAEWHPQEENLQTGIVDDKALEILQILQDQGISAHLSSGKAGMSRTW